MELTDAEVRDLFHLPHGHVFEDPQQDTFDTARVYLYTFYTRRVLERELSFFESGALHISSILSFMNK
ncbi:hypothetical protein [Bacillus sp. JCM 19041]|uniref:hypothetical protein n=1 Tax=Bacillus sp. JCM 19041 TaxID=1460637 RepID=UPI0006D0955D